MIRWILLIVGTAATAAIIVMIVAMDGGPFGAASVYLIAAIAVAWLAGIFVWYRRSRHSKSSGWYELHLDRVDSVRTPSGRIRDHEVPAIIGAGERAAASEPIEESAHRLVHLEDYESVPPFDQQPTDADPVPLEEDAVSDALGSDVAGSAPSPEQIQVEETAPSPASVATPRVPPDRSSDPAPSASGGAGLRDIGSDAERLAEVLNLYERIDRSNCDPLGADRVPGRQGLWDELVEEYGVASIDLRDLAYGGCTITLSSGNLVFYAPQRRRWVWVVFDGMQPPRSSSIDPLPSGRIVANPN